MPVARLLDDNKVKFSALIQQESTDYPNEIYVYDSGGGWIFTKYVDTVDFFFQFAGDLSINTVNVFFQLHDTCSTNDG